MHGVFSIIWDYYHLYQKHFPLRDSHQEIIIDKALIKLICSCTVVTLTYKTDDRIENNINRQKD
jgi:hypothetical protein